MFNKCYLLLEYNGVHIRSDSEVKSGDVTRLPAAELLVSEEVAAAAAKRAVDDLCSKEMLCSSQ